MAILKLTVSGSSMTLHVARCEVVQGNYDEQVKFTMPNGDQLFLPRKSADRQLFRCGFGTEDAPGEYNIAYGDVDGHTLLFSRDPNAKMPAKPFWGITRVADADVPRPSLTAAAKAEAERVRLAKGLPVEEDEDALGPTIPGLDGYVHGEDNEEDRLASLVQMAEEQITPKLVGIPASTIDKRQAIAEAYRQAWVAALDVQGPDSTAEALNAGAATILIAWQKAGLV